jgi:hypothetical protein
VGVGKGRVEVLLQVLLDDRSVVAGNQFHGDKALFKTLLADSVQGAALEMKLHLASDETPTFRARAFDGAATLLRLPVLIEDRLVPVEVR